MDNDILVGSDNAAVEEVMATAARIVFGVILPALGELMAVVIKSGITVDEMCGLADMADAMDPFYSDDDGPTC